MNNEKDENFRKWNHTGNMEKLGDELSRYLTLKDLCEKQNVLIKSLYLEIGYLKSELAESEDMKEMWRSKYLKTIENEDLGEFQDLD